MHNKPFIALGCALALAGVTLLAAARDAAQASSAQAAQAHGPIDWRDWSDQVFVDARAQKKYVLLDLGAVWCHWCHVMEATTYQDAKVAQLIREHFIPVRVDQDARPDLSRRYEAFGWPATIVMDADGNDIGKMRGYREPERLLHTLDAILKDPSPLFNAADDDRDKTFSGTSRLSEATRAEIDRRFHEAIDTRIGGLVQAQRFLSRDTLEYGMSLGARGERAVEQWVRLTLANARALIDPVWGGMYQYSTDGDWKHPHYEKIMEIQANAMTLYAQAYRLYGEPALLDSAQAVRRYVKGFLTSPDGAFYTSQDADRVPGEQGDSYFALDDAERRARGVPRIDKHVYARENGWMIEALVELYGASGDASVLDDAVQAARFIVAQRGNADGSFRHDTRDTAGPFLGDNLAMGRAMLALYSATGERDWLQRARKVRAGFARFAAPNGGGYLSTPPLAGSRLKARPHIDENIDVARFANLLHRYSGDAEDAAAANIALRYVSGDSVALRVGLLPAIASANAEAAADPLHITLVGAKDDARSAALYRAALAQGAGYRRIEWWAPKEGKLVNPDVRYPVLDRPAAFVCTDRTCSVPLFDAADIAGHLAANRQQASNR